MVKLYSTHCPKCNVLEKKIRNAKIDFIYIDDFDINEMTEKGIMSAPILQVDDTFMEFSDAIKWVNENKGV